MTLWKSEHGAAYGPALHKLGPRLDLSVVLMAATASSVLLVWLVPPPLVLPALGLVSFTAAGVVAQSGAASRSRARRMAGDLKQTRGPFSHCAHGGSPPHDWISDKR